MTTTEEEFQEMTPAEFKWAVHIERQAQVEKGYTAEHDDAKGAAHLVNQAIDYARRGKPLKAAAIMVALSEHLERIAHPVVVEAERVAEKVVQDWMAEGKAEDRAYHNGDLYDVAGLAVQAGIQWRDKNRQVAHETEVMARLNAIGRILVNEQSWGQSVARERKTLEATHSDDPSKRPTWTTAPGHYDGDGCTFPAPGHLIPIS